MLQFPTDLRQIDLHYKWELDGSESHTIYKQTFTNNSKYLDSNFIISTIIPLEKSVMQRDKKFIFWKKLSPSWTKCSTNIAEITGCDEEIHVNINFNIKLPLSKAENLQHKQPWDGKNLRTKWPVRQIECLCSKTVNDVIAFVSLRWE